MIAHVAQTGEDRGRVVLHLKSGRPNAIALEAAVRVAQAFGSDLESIFVEDEQLFDCAAYGFVREVSFSGTRSRALSLDGMMRDLHLAAQGARRQVEAIARRAEVPLRCRVVRDEPLRALSIACAETGPWNVVALGEPFTGGTGATLQAGDDGGGRLHRAHRGRAQGAARHRRDRGGSGGHRAALRHAARGRAARRARWRSKSCCY